MALKLQMIRDCMIEPFCLDWHYLDNNLSVQNAFHQDNGDWKIKRIAPQIPGEGIFIIKRDFIEYLSRYHGGACNRD